MDKDPPMVDPLRPLCFSDNSDHITYTSLFLSPEELKVLEGVLQYNKDVFVWARFDMSDIYQLVASHRLNILPSSKPIHQKVWCFYPNRQKIIQTEVDKLLITGFIREVEYLDWSKNIVVVPNKGGKWQVCVDYTNLNDAMSKGQLPISSDRSNSWLHCWTSNAFFHIWFLRLPQNPYVLIGRGKNSIHNTTREPLTKGLWKKSSKLWSARPWRSTSMILW